jgi:hypothetical protein
MQSISIISIAFLSIPESFLSISLLSNERTGIALFEIKVDEMSFGDTDTDTDNGQTCCLFAFGLDRDP